jgi:hypothetical protein
MITYRGQKFAGYNKPKSTPGASKKSAVLAKEDGKVRLVRFGDPKMPIKKHIPKNRKSFRARHGCDTPGTKLSAKYWSCRAWKRLYANEIRQTGPQAEESRCG